MLSLLLVALLSTQPEIATDVNHKSAVYGRKMMVVTANPIASEAAISILNQGGNALDAAIAAQLVLNVVEPQSSGLGGGGFLLYYRKKDDQVIAFDGREFAPEKVSDTLFVPGEPVIGGKTVGVPGLLAMLEKAHQEEGVVDWPLLFDSAIGVAKEGFPISHRLALQIQKTAHLDTFEATRNYLFEAGSPKQEGATLKNPELAETLRTIASQGAIAFYRGDIGKAIVEAVQQAPINPGFLTLEDLMAYAPVKREPLKTVYKEHEIYGFPPPSGGGIAVAQILKMLNYKNLNPYHLGALPFITLFCNASQLAFADRNYYVGDPDFFQVPVKQLLSDNYLKQRSDLFNSEEALKDVAHGTWPQREVALNLHSSLLHELSSTSHICVADSDGNVVSLSTSIENAFGSTLFVKGFFLNNQLTDFSFSSGLGGIKAANSIAPHKRPMSAMSPTLIFKDKIFRLAVGSAGGPWIIDYVAQAIMGVIDFELDIQDAISFPHYGAINQTVHLEEKTSLEKYLIPLQEKGFEVEMAPMPSGTEGIEMRYDIFIGGADPRREGSAISRI